MRKIGLVLTAPPTYSETFLNSKIRNMIEAGIDVTVFSGGKKGKFFFRHLIIPPLNWKIVLFFPWVFLKLYILRYGSMLKLFRLCQKENIGVVGFLKIAYLNSTIIIEKPDVLHYEFSALASGREMLAAAIDAEMIVSFRGYDIALHPLLKPDCFKLMVRYTDKIHSISNFYIRRVHQYGFSDEIPTYLITPAVNTALFPIISNPGNLDSGIKIITIGRLIWQKGNQYALRTASLLKERGLKFIWHFVGEGQEMEMMRFMVKCYHLEKYIVLHGRVPHEKMPELLAHCNIYVQSSVQEGFCNAVLEAQCAGLLTIVTDAEGLPENVLHRITGLVVPRRNPSAMADAVMELVAMDENMRIQMAQTAAARVRQEFDLANQKEAFNKFYGI